MAIPRLCSSSRFKSNGGSIMNCIKCNNEIPLGRLEAIPGTKTCVNCSSTSKWYVRSVVTGKTTYSETEIIKDESVAESLKQMDRRVGWGSNLYKVH